MKHINYLNHKSKINILKIDIEGAEYEVILDCENSLSNINNIFLEYHSFNGEAQQLSDILRIFEKNKLRYYIQGLSNKKHPFIGHNNKSSMDLQLNIWAYRS